MAEDNKDIGMPKGEITELKQALFAQQGLLQKLYSELDVEREYAASAASEALSMILRLQGEKAAIKMEAIQYKRLAEEKMCYSEEALAIFEDLIYHKEMEIASLEYQVQAYKYKLLSLGCTDIGVCETKFPENLLQRRESLAGELAGLETNLRRSSVPPIPFKFSCQKKASLRRGRSLSPVVISTPEENKDSEVDKKRENSPPGDINLYWEEIKRLDKRVRHILDFKEPESKSFVPGLTKDIIARSKSPLIEHPQISPEMENNFNPSNSSNVYDVFEVPIVHECEKAYEAPAKLRPKKGKSIPKMASNSYGKDENKPARKMFSNEKGERKFSISKQSHMVQLDNGMSEIVEAEGPGGSYQEREDEKFILLKEIKEQLNLIQGEIKSMKKGKCYPAYELPLLSLSEAMLHFCL